MSARPFPLEPLLGHVPDEVLAERFDLEVEQVRARRLAHAPVVPSPTELERRHPELILLWGTQGDRAIARRVGLSQKSVTAARKRRGIPAGRGYADPRSLRLAGKLPDHVVAEIDRTDASRVRTLRSEGSGSFRDHVIALRASGFFEAVDAGQSTHDLVQAFEVDPEVARYFQWMAAAAAPRIERDRTLLTTADVRERHPSSSPEEDRSVARIEGVAEGTVRRRRSRIGTVQLGHARGDYFDRHPAHLPLLGTMADRELARRLDIRPGRVGDARRRRGIERYRPAPVGIAARRPREWTEEEREVLGLLPHKVHAAVFRRSIRVIRAWLAAEDLETYPAHMAKWRLRGLAELLATNPRPEDLAAQLGIPLMAARYQVWRGGEERARVRRRRQDNAALQPEALFERYPWLWQALADDRLDECVERAGVPKTRLLAARQVVRDALRDQPKPRSFDAWLTPERRAQLGTRFDTELAEAWGRTVKEVTYARTMLEIPAKGRERDTDRLLGWLPDSEIARMDGVAAESIRVRRVRRDIASWGDNYTRLRDAGALSKPMGTPESFAETHGVPLETAKHLKACNGHPDSRGKRWRPPWVLGD